MAFKKPMGFDIASKLLASRNWYKEFMKSNTNARYSKLLKNASLDQTTHLMDSNKAFDHWADKVREQTSPRLSGPRKIHNHAASNPAWTISHHLGDTPGPVPPVPPTPTVTGGVLFSPVDPDATVTFARSFQYSTDDGVTWQQGYNSVPITLPALVKAQGTVADDAFATNVSASTGRFNVAGDVRWLADENGLKTNFKCTSYGGSYGLFSNSKVVDASGLDLSHVDPSPSVFAYMFSSCTDLTTIPTLPLTTLTDSCYKGMFSGCTSLTSAPDLPILTLQPFCYAFMFEGCALTEVPAILAEVLAEHACRGMFKDCKSLTHFKSTAPSWRLLPTTLPEGAYCEMFAGCDNLSGDPIIGVTDAGYNRDSIKGMFIDAGTSVTDFKRIQFPLLTFPSSLSDFKSNLFGTTDDIWLVTFKG